MLLVCLLSQCNFYVSCLCRQTACSMLCYGVHTNDTAIGEGRMIVRKLLENAKCLTSHGMEGQWKRALLPAFFCPLLFAVPPASLTGLEGVMSCVAVSHLMGSKSHFSDFLACSLTTLMPGVTSRGFSRAKATKTLSAGLEGNSRMGIQHSLVLHPF